MALSIPKRHRPIIGHLLGLPSKQLERLLKALSGIKKPSLSLEEMSKQVAGRSSLDEQSAEDVLLMLVSLYNIPRTETVKKAQLLSDLLSAIESDNEFAATDDQIALFRPFIEGALALDETIGVAAKSFILLGGHEYLYCKATIFTDLRPVFADEIDRDPSGFVLSHMLRISYHPRDFSVEDLYVALGPPDLENLADVIERAQKKESQLRKLAKKAGIDIFARED